MNYLILFTLLFGTSTTLLAQSSSVTSETATNQTLLDNAAAAQKILDAQSANKPPTSIQILSNKGSSSTKTSKTNLTDQEKQLSENYVDQAKANKIIQEKCVGEMVQGCRGDEVDHKIMGMSPAMMKLATQAYATFGAMGDFMPVSKGTGEWFNGKPAATTGTGTGTGTAGAAGGAQTPAPAAAGADKTATANNSPAKDGDKKAEDYCKYIPAATETIAKFTQQSNVQSIDKQIPTGADTAQKDGLLKAAKSHDSRAEQAQIQAVGWYGGAACYAYKATTGAFAIDTALVVKLGAATLLGTFYQMEVAANKEYAQKTRDIANSLPGKGECNPVTENDCYCAEPEHANDPQFCQAQIAAKAAGSNFTKVACTDSNLKIDPTCACDKTNTCFDKFLQNQGAGELQLGIGYTNSPFKPIASLAHGKLEGGTLNTQSFSGTAAIAKKALNDLASRVPASNSPLTAAQKEIADAAIAKGLPANVARLMAQNSPSQSALDSAKAKMGDIGSGYELASYSPSGKSNVVDFSGGNGLGLGGKKGDKKSGMEDFLGKINPNSKANNGKILEFAQRAEKQAAQITKSDRPLFEIISLRYQTSGRRLLQLDSSN